LAVADSLFAKPMTVLCATVDDNQANGNRRLQEKRVSVFVLPDPAFSVQ
jgi:hypothetical protein